MKIPSNIIATFYDENRNTLKQQYSAILVNGKEVLHGKNENWYSSGTLRSQLMLKLGKLNGPAKFWFRNGCLARSGRYLNGQKNGIWRFWHPNGELSAKMCYRNGRLNGECCSWNLSGCVKKRFFENGIDITDGVVRQLHFYTRHFKNQKLRCQLSYYYDADGDPILHGTSIVAKRNGDRVDIPYLDGIPFGQGCIISYSNEVTIEEFQIEENRIRSLAPIDLNSDRLYEFRGWEIY